MKRLMSLLVTLGVMGVMLSNGPLAAAASIEYFYDFNSTLAPFTGLADPSFLTSVDDNVLTLSKDCYVGESPLGGLDGMTNSCALLTKARGTRFAAMLTQLKGDGITVQMDFVARNLEDCWRCMVMVYAGSGKPQGLSSFQIVGPQLSTQWTEYGYRALLGGSDPVIAVGILEVGDSVGAAPGDGLIHDGQRAIIDNLKVQFSDN
jgi:hypothetical protein